MLPQLRFRCPALLALKGMPPCKMCTRGTLLDLARQKLKTFRTFCLLNKCKAAFPESVVGQDNIFVQLLQCLETCDKCALTKELREFAIEDLGTNSASTRRRCTQAARQTRRLLVFRHAVQDTPSVTKHGSLLDCCAVTKMSTRRHEHNLGGPRPDVHDATMLPVHTQCAPELQASDQHVRPLVFCLGSGRCVAQARKNHRRRATLRGQDKVVPTCLLASQMPPLTPSHRIPKSSLLIAVERFSSAAYGPQARYINQITVQSAHRLLHMKKDVEFIQEVQSAQCATTKLILAAPRSLCVCSGAIMRVNEPQHAAVHRTKPMCAHTPFLGMPSSELREVDSCDRCSGPQRSKPAQIWGRIRPTLGKAPPNLETSPLSEPANTYPKAGVVSTGARRRRHGLRHSHGP